MTYQEPNYENEESSRRLTEYFLMPALVCFVMVSAVGGLGYNVGYEKGLKKGR